MSTQHGEAGVGARKIGQKKAIRYIILVLAFYIAGAILIFISRYLLHPNLFLLILALLMWVCGLGLMFYAAYIAIFNKKINREIDRAFQGAQAEIKVSEFLGGFLKAIQLLMILNALWGILII